MNIDNEWVEDVKRWCRAGGTAATSNTLPATPAEDDAASFGYEAANPALQARHWPEPASTLATSTMTR